MEINLWSANYQALTEALDNKLFCNRVMMEIK